MNEEFEFQVRYGTSIHKLKAKIEYHSAQIVRIRVQGSFRSMLFESNFPVWRVAKGSKPIKWQIREGAIISKDSRDARLTMDIIENLEGYLKQEFPRSW